MGFANAYMDRKKKLEQKSLIDKYHKSTPSIQVKEQEG